MNKYYALSALLLSFLIINCGSQGEEKPKIEFSENKNLDILTKALNTHLRSVKIKSGAVAFVSGGEFGVYDSKHQLNKEFSLSLGQSFSHKKDRHSKTSFELIEITDSGVVLKYTSSFQHMSFGKNLVTKDTGEIKILYK